MGENTTSRIVVIFAIIIYLFLLFTLFNYVGDTFGEDSIRYSQMQQDFNGNIAVNIITGIDIIPFWLNIIFFGIPVVAVAWLIFVEVKQGILI